MSRLGTRIVLGTPLGAGKPNALLNAIYRRAQADPTLRLEIITALSLSAPRGASELEERFYRPIRARVWGQIPPLSFLDDRGAGRLPDNVRVLEFYARPGSILGNPRAQQDFINTNYTQVARDMLARGVNLLMQAVALREEHGHKRYSWSCNPDVTPELLSLLKAEGRRFVLALEVHRQFPFFGHACELDPEDVQLVVDDPALDHAPFAVPHEPVDLAAWAIGLRAAALVRDHGTLQVGIGALGDATCHALRLRHRQSALFAAALDALGRDAIARELGGDGAFSGGLYIASELISNALFVLFEEGIARRLVYEELDAQLCALDAPERAPEGLRGTALQGAFLLGSSDFYRRLSALPESERDLIDMNSVAEVNRIYTDYRLERAQRRHARFLNMTMFASLLGSAVSDQLRDGQVLSGVGGQNDFVSMAHQLPDGRSALLLRASSRRAGKLQSNLVWEYPHATIPRQLRDLFVTEYGVADLRAKTDRECIEAMLAIADSRFQEALLAEAQRAGKLPKDARIPDRHRQNLPARIERALAPLRAQGALPELPFGSDLRDAEWALAARLKKLRAASEDVRGKLRLAEALRAPAPAEREDVRDALMHLELAAPRSAREKWLARLVRAAYAL